MSEDGELVETGGFRVDRSRALEKLRAFRNEAVGAVGFFVRAAVAAGARTLTVDEADDAVTLCWGGTPLSPRFFDDPYLPLFTEGSSRSRAERWLGLGLLHAFGPGVRRVSVESGDPRRRIAASDIDKEAAEPAAGAGETVVRVEGAVERLWSHPAAGDASLPPGVIWTDMFVRWPYRRRTMVAPDAPPGSVTWKGGELIVPETAGQSGRLALYVDGVLAGGLRLPEAALTACARAEVPDLRLDATFSSFSTGPETERAAAEAVRRAPGFLAGVRAEHERRMKRTGPAMKGNPWLARLWERRLKDDPGLEDAVERVLSGPEATATDERAAAARDVLYDAQVDAWMRRLGNAGLLPR